MSMAHFQSGRNVIIEKCQFNFPAKHIGIARDERHSFFAFDFVLLLVFAFALFTIWGTVATACRTITTNNEQRTTNEQIVAIEII